MDQLVVNNSLLEATATSLSFVADAFDEAAQVKEALQGSLGSGMIAEAMDEFVDNWDRHRQELVASMRDLEKHASAVIATFAQTDSELGKALQITGPPSGVGL